MHFFSYSFLTKWLRQHRHHSLKMSVSVVTMLVPKVEISGWLNELTVKLLTCLP